MAHASNSSAQIIADLTAACTSSATADFGVPATVGTPGVATAGVGGVVQGILPDTILCDTTAAAFTLILPKIGTQACPVGSTVAIRKFVAAAGVITVTANVVGASDLIDGAATNVTAFPIAATLQTAWFRACSVAASTGVGQWRTIASSLPAI